MNTRGTLEKVYVGWDTWLTCTSHAFSTEKQEIMGLLLGRWPQAEELARLAHNNRIIDKNTGSEAGAITDPGAALVAAHALVGKVAVVEDALVLARTDRRKDRVEVGLEQLAAASEMAEAHSKRTGRECRVIGWYPSHPHITVEPSHVDVRTQGQYQAMDPAFLGLIFSVFSQVSLFFCRSARPSCFSSLHPAHFSTATIVVVVAMSISIDRIPILSCPSCK